MLVSKERILHVLIMVVAVSFVIFFLDHFQLSKLVPIKTVKVYGLTHISQQEVKELVQPLVNQSYFNINLESIRDRLRQIPWVSDISVKRIWPDQVAIMVVERNAIAHWHTQQLLSTNGEVFKPKAGDFPNDLPWFFGPEGKQMVMLEYFAEINRILLPIHAKISRLELTPYSTWMLTLNNGIILRIGHKDILTRLGHFVKVYSKIIGEHTADVDYIDLRYSNGVAVRWKVPVKSNSV